MSINISIDLSSFCKFLIATKLFKLCILVVQNIESLSVEMKLTIKIQEYLSEYNINL